MLDEQQVIRPGNDPEGGRRRDDIMNRKTIRRGVIGLAIAGTAVAGGQGMVDAQEEDYPPVPAATQPTTVSPDSPDESTDRNDGAPAGATLPQTGGPGTMSILLAAGVAVAAGAAITGVAARRREGDLGVA